MISNPYIDPDYVANLEARLKDAEQKAANSVPVDQIGGIVAQALSQALSGQREIMADVFAARETETAKKATAVAEPVQSVVPETPVAAKLVDLTSPLYGNRDVRQQFNLREMTTLRELPTDKVIIVLPVFNRDGDGAPIGYDYKNCRVQYIDPVAHYDRKKTDKETGSSIYKLSGVEPVEVHVP